MADEKIVESILDRLKPDSITLSEDKTRQLIAATTNALDNFLASGYSVDIDDFGSFIRRTGDGGKVYTNFRPTERLKERINKG